MLLKHGPVERIGDYKPKSVTGFLPETSRTLVTDFGVIRQSDDEYFDASQYSPDEWMHVAKAKTYS